jgi:hypothetical protein
MKAGNDQIALFIRSRRSVSGDCAPAAIDLPDIDEAS